MNNSQLALETPEPEIDYTPTLRQKQAELEQIISAVNAVLPYWKDLNELVFKGLVKRLETRLTQEAGRSEINTAEIYRLQGQLQWARRYSDLYKLVEAYKEDLNNITLKLNENGTN